MVLRILNTARARTYLSAAKLHNNKFSNELLYQECSTCTVQCTRRILFSLHDIKSSQGQTILSSLHLTLLPPYTSIGNCSKDCEQCHTSPFRKILNFIDPSIRWMALLSSTFVGCCVKQKEEEVQQYNEADDIQCILYFKDHAVFRLCFLQHYSCSQLRLVLCFRLAVNRLSHIFIIICEVDTLLKSYKFNPSMPNSDLQILLCLTPDDYTRQRETPWALKG